MPFHIIETAGNAIIDTINTGLAPTSLVFHDPSQRGFIPAPFGDDGLIVIDLPLAVVGDLDGDCAVGPIDLAMLLASWGPCPEPCTPGDPADTCAADLNGDCIVGPLDLATLLANWG